MCYDILSKPLDASSDMKSPLPDENMNADGEFNNVKVRKKKESPPLNSLQDHLPPRLQVVKLQRAINNFTDG